jgi:HlyD family secretion protein
MVYYKKLDEYDKVEVLMFFRKKSKKIRDIEHVPMEQPFDTDDMEDITESEKLEKLEPIIDDEEEILDSLDESKLDIFGEEEEETFLDSTDLLGQDDLTEDDLTEEEEPADSAEPEKKKRKKSKKQKKEKKNKKEKKDKIKLSKKKKIAIGLILLVVLAGGASLYIFGVPGLSSGTKIYVQKVSEIINLGSGNGGQNRYAGVVESQETWTINQSSDKTVKEIYVEEGDTVKVGDKLLAYDNDEAQLNLEQAQLELERMQSELKSGEAEITTLEKEKKSASSSEQLEYTIQIQSQKATNKKTEYEIKSQKAKIKTLKKATKNSVVKSEIDGVVKKINQSALSSGTSSDDDDGDDTVLISILATGDYRIKAKVNEQNKYEIEEGKAVIIRSRVDDSVTWTGTISELDTDNPEQDSSSSYYDTDDDDETTTSSKYPFYITLDSSEGLTLGQHVYIETDEGQDEEKSGLWLDSYYIVQDENDTYVWAESLTKRLEKKKVTLGQYDEDLDKYEITDGLDEDDYIAFPTSTLEEGMRTTRNEEEATTDDSDDGDYDYEGSTDDMLLDDWDDTDMDLEDSGEDVESLDETDQDASDTDEIWEEDSDSDDATNEDGTVGFLDDQTEVLL